MKQEPVEVQPILYTERETRLIHEAKLFDDFVIVRPVMPGMAHQIRRLDHVSFASEFDEYGGNPQDVWNFLAGAEGNGLVLV